MLFGMSNKPNGGFLFWILLPLILKIDQRQFCGDFAIICKQINLHISMQFRLQQAAEEDPLLIFRVNNALDNGLNDDQVVVNQDEIILVNFFDVLCDKTSLLV